MRFDIRKRKDEFVLLIITVFVEVLLCFWAWNIGGSGIMDQVWVAVGGLVVAMPFLFRIDRYI